MPDSRPVVLVSDAHLTPERPDVSDLFHRFLARVPDLGSHLIINGDLFEFWFEYKAVIPRSAFATLAALAQLRQAGCALTVFGGNHDRWGGSFWRRELGADYYAETAELSLAGWPALVTHGDDVGGDGLAGRLLGRIVRSRLTIGTFRRIHPDLGFAIVRRLSRLLAARRGDRVLIESSMRAQAAFAHSLLEARADLALVVMGHTHQPVLESVGAGRWYMNPGAWVEGSRYAVIGPHGPELHAFT